jgi:hypothetical protein
MKRTKRVIKRPNKFSFILLGLLFFNNRLADKEMEVEAEVEVKRQLVGFSPNQVANDGTWKVRNKLLILALNLLTDNFIFK